MIRKAAKPIAAIMALTLLAACETLPPAPAFSETARLHAACPAEKAIYSLPDSTAELRLVKTAHAVNAYSDLAIRVEANRHVLWFSFVQSMGYGRMFVGYINDPTAPDAAEAAPFIDGPQGNELGLFDADLKAIPIPQAGDDAPAYLFAPGIGSRFWYDLIDRTPVPIGMWRLTACAP